MTECTKIYNTGRLYKITSQVDQCFYIGATTSTLNKRRNRHKAFPTSKKMAEWFKRVGFDNLEFTQLESYPNITRLELSKKEDAELKIHMINGDCLNSLRSYLTPEEKVIRLKRNENRYLMSHKDQKKESNRLNYIRNKARLDAYNIQYRKNNPEKRKVRVTCKCCGTKCLRAGLARHNKNMNHIINLIEY